MDKPDLPGFFGEWVKKRRKALDLTQEELAQRAGCSVFALRKIESGERRPSKQLAELLAESLQLLSEEKQTFIRVARGETSLERLHLPSLEPFYASLSDRQPAPVTNRIPIQFTSLVGRDSELAAMAKLLNDPQCRLLTLTGMGGIGKTRLAIEFATRQQLAFPAGVFYVPLAPIVSADAVVPAMADVFGFVFSGPNEPKEQLINYIAVHIKQSLLLVLDNLEHLLVQSVSDKKQSAVELIFEILQRLPNIKILTTSRERLNLRGEWTYELHGLAVPPQEIYGKLEEYSAVALFIESAKRTKADLELTANDQLALIQICQLLDGTPLAIELAAAWVEVLSCQEILQEIGSNIDFLTTSMRDIPERHRSLRATFDHSWKLLSDYEQGVLSRLSVFRGGFDRIAAEMVAYATLPLLASLVSKSLVRRTQEGRYDLHEVIRQFASSHLEDNQARCGETCGLHSEYYLKLSSEYERKLKSASQQAAMHDMSLELDNFRTAWEWGIRNGKFESIGIAVRSFGWFFEVSGLIRDGIDQLEMLVQALQNQKDNVELNRLLGLALLHQGLLYFRKGLFIRAEKLYRDSIAILRPTKDQSLLADALIFLGTITHLNGEYTKSRDLLLEGLECAQASNDRWFEAYGIYNLGYVDSLTGDYQKGYEQMLVGLNIWRDIGDPHYIALGLNFLVTTLIKLELYEDAKDFMWESIALCEQAKNRWGMGTAYRYLGTVYLAEGQYTEAQAHFYRSLEIFGEYTEGWDIALSLYYLGNTVILDGNFAEAKNFYLKALRISYDAHSFPIALDSILGLAQVYVQTGKAEFALELLHCILDHPATVQETKDRAIEVSNEARNMLTNIQAQTSEEKIQSQSFDELVSNILL
jgi:predicted ATPase/transcriptional regulator with XRE-family HTH domain